MKDEKAALLGDHEAARRLTEAGVLLACPFCAGKGEGGGVLAGRIFCKMQSGRDAGANERG